MTTHGLTPCTEMVKGFWASSSGTPAFPFQKERAESATRLELTTLPHESFKIFSNFWKFFFARLAPGIRPGEFKNGSRRRKEADFGAKNTSASLPRRLRLLRRFLNSPCLRTASGRCSGGNLFLRRKVGAAFRAGKHLVRIAPVLRIDHPTQRAHGVEV